MTKNNNKGFILLLTFILMAALVVMVGAFIYLLRHKTIDTGIQIDNIKILNVAEAGIERAKRAILDDAPPAGTQTGTADLRGANTEGSRGFPAIGNDPNVFRYQDMDSGWASIVNLNDLAVLQDFDRNYIHSRISTVSVGVVARYRGGGPDPKATIQLGYTTDGINCPEAGTTAFDQSLTASFDDGPYFNNITGDQASWDWATIMDTTNFAICAKGVSGSRPIEILFLFLRVTYEIDTETEDWKSGFTNLSVGEGTASVSIADEQGKVHLNTASESLLSYLLQEHGVDQITADDLAQKIVAARQFDTVEELQQVVGMTPAIYASIKNDVTVYSYINTYATGPDGNRAPININTAPQAVLEAVFDPLLSIENPDVPTLAGEIITQRAATPFTSFYSATPLSTPTDFYHFIDSRSYLSDNEKDQILGNADASALAPVRFDGAVYLVETAEFSYETNAFHVQSVGQVNNRQITVDTVLGDDGSSTFTTYTGDTTSAGYRKEAFTTPAP